MESCQQQVKDKNFESNSQPSFSLLVDCARCQQQVKDKNFESNSQPIRFFLWKTERCQQQVKDKNFESNSQLQQYNIHNHESCQQQVKDKNFESNSQRRIIETLMTASRKNGQNISTRCMFCSFDLHFHVSSRKTRPFFSRRRDVNGNSITSLHDIIARNYRDYARYCRDRQRWRFQES